MKLFAPVIIIKFCQKKYQLVSVLSHDYFWRIDIRDWRIFSQALSAQNISCQESKLHIPSKNKEARSQQQSQSQTDNAIRNSGPPRPRARPPLLSRARCARVGSSMPLLITFDREKEDSPNASAASRDSRSPLLRHGGELLCVVLRRCDDGHR